MPLTRIILIYILFLTAHALPSPDSTVILSEVMFHPSAAGNEYIELYNTSEKPVNLHGYMIKYQNSAPDSILPVSGSSFLPPYCFAVVLEGDYDFAAGIYNNLIPQGALIFKIDDNAFGSSGMSNTEDRTVSLVFPDNQTAEQYTYTAGNKAGYSDAKQILTADFASAQWTDSYCLHGTPGFKNTPQVLSRNLKMISLTWEPQPVFMDSAVTLKASVYNSGTEAAEDYFIDFYTAPHSAAPALLTSLPGPPLNPEDSASAQARFTPPDAGNYIVTAVINYQSDQQPADDTIKVLLTVHPPGIPFNTLVINEIMYAPLSGGPEWLEIFNNGAEAINLKGFKINDLNSSAVITPRDLFLPPFAYAVAAADSAILDFYEITAPLIITNLPSLNNSGDRISLADSLGSLQDLVPYSPSWGGLNGSSLERRIPSAPGDSPSNWGSSLHPTPGGRNSITPKNNDIAIISFIPLKPYFIVFEPVQFEIKIRNTGINISAPCSLLVYRDLNADSAGGADELIQILNVPSLIPGDSVFVNCTAPALPQGIHHFIASAEYPDEDINNNTAFAAVTVVPEQPAGEGIVLNEVMYAPAGGEPEWIEIFNPSSSHAQLSGISISDIKGSTSSALLPELVIPPLGFVLFTADSAVFDYHSYIPSLVIKIKLPVLNNDTDGVVLKDPFGRIIDSVSYIHSAKAPKGASLERTESGNNIWFYSKDSSGSTPGRKNSVSPKEHNVAMLSLLPSITSPLPGDTVRLTAHFKNTGTAAAQFILNILINDNIILSEAHTLQPGASTEAVTPYITIENILYITALLIYSADEDTSDNRLTLTIRAGGMPGNLVINEIMYSPGKEMPEWVELYNNSASAVNLKNWTISDLLSSPKPAFISLDDALIPPGTYIVISRDSSFMEFNPGCPALAAPCGAFNNSEDAVIIKDQNGSIIDSVYYNSSWGGSADVSLERISFSAPGNDPANWASSLTGSTPGLANSISGLGAAPPHAVIINEILYDPAPGNSEFIELYNNCSDTIDICGWTLHDASGFCFLSLSPLTLPPRSYFLLAADSSVIDYYSLQDVTVRTSKLSLSNSGEQLLLKDPLGNTSDSVHYMPGWHNPLLTVTKNRSLERINPSINAGKLWSSSADPAMATPGRRNSLFTPSSVNHSTAAAAPNPFSPDNDGWEDFTVISYNLPGPAAAVRIKIFDSKGRLVRTLPETPSAASGSVIFDGIGDDGIPLRIGIYIILLESVNISGSLMDRAKTLVVIARKL